MTIKRFALALFASAALFAAVGCRHRCGSTREANTAADCCKD